MKISKNEFNILNLTNFCKGIAIAWVVLVHYQGQWFGWQGVHIFIVLSGFGLTYSCLSRNENPQGKAWYFRRIRKLLPVYWLTVLCSLPLLIILQMFQGEIKPNVVQTFLDFFLLRNFFEQFMSGPTSAFWYVPFILSCYLVFPLLYSFLRKCSTIWDYLLFLSAVSIIEFVYRALAIYWLDGLPIIYSHSQFFGLFPDPVAPLDRHPDQIFGLFQRRAPFGFFPSRIAEFTLGALAAVALIRDNHKVNQTLLNRYTGLVGMLIWIVGQVLLCVGLWGWIFADFVISLGSILWILYLAYFCQKFISNVFKWVTLLGVWSYYIYLTHEPFIRALRRIVLKLFSEGINLSTGTASVLIFGLTIALVYVASWLIQKFDRSKIPDQVVHKMSRLLD
ncbi:acyltransferase family protein [Aliterella atlantica]|uniref:Acyltransferase 3 domain-containing protein n=1 Tax=Aliterella atlantica CENA595 TaxID=1618023 RepID=A0A0D8ZQJ0_9CYAN|nr:acyltransferase [Aliterella atlantica]KJH70617.1 hypothetical protein UH38_17055 [Aliterella atlantica CENA595]